MHLDPKHLIRGGMRFWAGVSFVVFGVGRLFGWW